jgi:hypothetical protein
MFEFFKNVRGVQERFGRDAAAKQAGAAQVLVFLNDRRAQAQLPRSDRGDVSARAGPYYRHVKHFAR